MNELEWKNNEGGLYELSVGPCAATVSASGKQWEVYIEVLGGGRTLPKKFRTPEAGMAAAQKALAKTLKDVADSYKSMAKAIKGIVKNG